MSADGARSLSTRIVALSRYVDASYPADISPEAVDWRRIAKVCEEAGEAINAYAGSIGENPRKGVTNGLDKVLYELCDVALCALGAIEHLTDHAGNSPAMLAAHARHVAIRAGLEAQR